MFRAPILRAPASSRPILLLCPILYLDCWRHDCSHPAKLSAKTRRNQIAKEIPGLRSPPWLSPALLSSPLRRSKWQQRSQVFCVEGSCPTSSSSSSSSSTRPSEGVPGRPPRETPRAGHERPGCPGAGAGAADSEEDAACGARELLATVGERNCIHHSVPLARGLFTRARQSARAGASSGCGLGEGSGETGEGSGETGEGSEGTREGAQLRGMREGRPGEAARAPVY